MRNLNNIIHTKIQGFTYIITCRIADGVSRSNKSSHSDTIGIILDTTWFINLLELIIFV